MTTDDDGRSAGAPAETNVEPSTDGGVTAASHPGSPVAPATIARPAVLYPNHYAWFVLTSSMDIMLTHTILHHFADFGGRELNTFADWVIRTFGLPGAIGLKFMSVIVVVVICEFIGRRRITAGRKLATAALVISLVPIAAALGQLARFAVTGPY